ncbi:MAG: SsrA-binding protein SmpB [Planctomycetes bacterium]|nr:SsrA-binding protein SmpB [Planctomycetota bacterium]MCA8946510.1 SsrA-binding protein SmpB [Planctomycetota bacterium]
MAKTDTESGRKVIASNRRAYHDYHVLEKYEAGIKLTGAEVKSLRAGHCVIADAHALIDKKKSLAWLMNLQIPEWNRGNQIEVHEPKRRRALLLHKNEILKLRQKLQEQGLTLVPLSVYFKHGFAKVEIGVCKGKKLYDKRQSLKEKQAKRDIARRVKR